MKEYKIVFKKEFKILLRGGMSLLLSIILPLIILPFALSLIISSEQKINKELNSPKIALYIVHNEIEHNIDSSTVEYKRQFNYVNDIILKSLTPNYQIVEDINKAFIYEKVNVALYIDSDVVEKVSSGKINIKLIYNSTYSSGIKNAQHIIKLISAYSMKVSDLRLQTQGSSLDEVSGMIFTQKTLQEAYPNNKVEGLNNLMLITIVPTIIIGFISFGSSSVSSELFSLEKEKNTLESLLTTSANRKNIVLSKLSVSVLFGVFGSICQVLSLVIAVLINSSYFTSSSIYFSSSSILLLVFSLFSLTLLASILNVFVYVFSKNHRNASALSSILMIGPVLLSYVVMNMSPSSMSFFFMFIPFIGTVLSTKMAIVGAINYSYLVTSLIVNLILSSILIYFIVKRYCSEKILTKE